MLKWRSDKMLKSIAYLLLFILYAFTLFTVVATAEFVGYENFLRSMTQENGVFETLSVLFLFSISFYGVYTLYFFRKKFSKYLYILILFASFLTFLAGMEEMSWGQHLFHFSSTEYFIENNLQQETNLHNFMDANLFSSLIYTSIYTLFVFIPLLSKLFFKDVPLLRYFDLNMHHILIILFSSTLQLYFYPDFGVYVDMFTQLLALALFGFVLWKEEYSPRLFVHYLLVVNTTIIFMLYHDVFDFLNMQYEIREMFVTLAVLFIFIDFIQKEKVK